MANGMIVDLTEDNIEEVNGGFWQIIAAAIIGEYAIGFVDGFSKEMNN